MKPSFTLGRDYALKTVAFVLLWCFGNVVLAQTTFFYADFPYDSVNLPQDYSKSVYGLTMGEVCSQRTDWEIYFGFGNPPSQLAYVGYLAPGTPNGSCGFKQFNTPPAPPGVNTTGTIPPNTRTCGDILFIASQVPNAAVPQACFTQCPQDQKGPDGICRLHSDKNSGLQCPLCNNPVNPATGNKLQVEIDLAEASAGGISLTRYYNSGRLSPHM